MDNNRSEEAEETRQIEKPPNPSQVSTNNTLTVEETRENDPEPIRLKFSLEQQQRYLENMTAVNDFIVIGHVRGRSPGVRKLTTWARINLHKSFKHFTIRANNYFEIQFARIEGVHVTLMERVYRLDNQNITFTA